MSVGTIMLIFAGALLFVYAVSGVLVNWLTRSVNADSSLTLPHATFWVERWTDIVAGHLYIWWLVRGRPGAGAGKGYEVGYEPLGASVSGTLPVHRRTLERSCEAPALVVAVQMLREIWGGVWF